ncbi:MAG: hypothetical protein ACYDH6_18330 [Acidimicrobiales bacterium]
MTTRTASGAGADALRREASILARARHPGVTELTSFTDDGTTARLVTADVGVPLTGGGVGVGGGGVGVGGGGVAVDTVVVRLATTVADLHDIGIAHNDVRLGNVRVSEGGRPVLTGWEHASLLDGPVHRRRHHPLARADDEAIADLARVLGALVEPLAEPARRHHRTRMAFSAASVAFVLIALAVHVGSDRAPRARPALGPITPVSDDVVTFGGHRYAIGRPGDIVRVARWACQATATPVLLRPATGEIWTFPRWPTWPAAVDGVPTTVVVGAATLEVSSVGRCDAGVVRRANGSSVPLQVTGR